MLEELELCASGVIWALFGGQFRIFFSQLILEEQCLVSMEPSKQKLEQELGFLVRGSTVCKVT